VREISVLSTLKASLKFKIDILPWNFCHVQHHLYVNNSITHVPNFKAKMFTKKKDIRNLLTCVVVKCFSLLPTLTTSQRFNSFFFAMKILEQKLLYVNKICSKFQGQKINKRKIITIYQHVSFWETIVETISLLQLWHPSKGLKIAYLLWKFFHKVFSMLITFVTNFKSKKFIQRKIFKIYQHV